MLTEDYCDFETAKLLKEKGFDEGCSFVVNAISKGVMPVSWPTTNSDIEDEKANLIALPTLQMVCKWLREVHNIDIIPFHEKLPNDCYWCRIEKYPYTEYNQDPIYKKYEESLNAAIKYCLENLIK